MCVCVYKVSPCHQSENCLWNSFGLSLCYNGRTIVKMMQLTVVCEQVIHDLRRNTLRSDGLSSFLLKDMKLPKERERKFDSLWDLDTFSAYPAAVSKDAVVLSFASVTAALNKQASSNALMKWSVTRK